MTRFWKAPKAPLAVAAILAMPLFFTALMATSLAVEKPTVVGHVLRHGRLVAKLGLKGFHVDPRLTPVVFGRDDGGGISPRAGAAIA